MAEAVDFWGNELDPADQQRLERHIEAACETHDVSWRQDSTVHWLQSEGDLEERAIRTPPIVRELDYWAALHEIGHFAAGGLPTEKNGTILWENELAVWLWALDNALIHPSGRAQGWILASFFSYPHSLAPDGVRARARARIGEGGFEPYRFRNDTDAAHAVLP